LFGCKDKRIRCHNLPYQAAHETASQVCPSSGSKPSLTLTYFTFSFAFSFAFASGTSNLWHKIPYEID
jgi:hypothetical protein